MDSDVQALLKMQLEVLENNAKVYAAEAERNAGEAQRCTSQASSLREAMYQLAAAGKCGDA